MTLRAILRMGVTWKTSPANLKARTSVPSILFISFVFFMLMNSRGDEFSVARDMYVNSFRSLNYQLGNFTAWRNGTESNFILVSPCCCLRSRYVRV